MQDYNYFNKNDVSQESQYAIPYHYIPSLCEGSFSQHLYWSWGINYLSGLNLVFDVVRRLDFESLIDIGCGDGRFLRELHEHFPRKGLQGVDVSKRAIDLAKALNPGISYSCHDIRTGNTLGEYFEIAVLIEVLEHIRPDDVYSFVEHVSSYQSSGDKLILTVPHVNKQLQPKHYQHFDSSTITSAVESSYKIDKLIFFEKQGKIVKRIFNLFLGNSLFILNNRSLLNAAYRFYQNNMLFCDENKCGRICLIGSKK